MRRNSRVRINVLAAIGQPEAQLTRGRRLARRGNHLGAARLFIRAAQSGSAAACLEVGRAYLLGLGLPSCPSVALRWLLQAASAGEGEAQLLLASLALLGVTKPSAGCLFKDLSFLEEAKPDYCLAMRWARMAEAADSEQIQAQAQVLLGFLLTSGPAEFRNLEEGKEWYWLAAGAENPHGQLGLSIILLQEGSVRNVAAAHDFLQAAAAADLPIAHYVMGVLAENGTGCPVDLGSAARHYRKGAALGDGLSQFRYGLALLDGRGLSRDIFEAETWLRRAALKGVVQAAATIGRLYTDGGNFPPNMAEATIWFRLAAKGDDAEAVKSLAFPECNGIASKPREMSPWLQTASLNGSPVAADDLASLVRITSASEADRREALARFQRLADGGDAAAAFNLGLCCIEGIGMMPNDEQAMHWFGQAAKQLAIAQFWCGRMHAEGRGGPQDLPAARAFFMRAADQKFQEAEAAAGEMLANGRGGPPDLVMARKLFMRAAAIDHPGALFALGMLACGACGEPEDPVAAHLFLSRAARCGHPRAKAQLGCIDAAACEAQGS